MTRTEYITKTDTITVVTEANIDSAKGVWLDSLEVTGTFIDSIKHDTILVVKYRPKDTVFTVMIYPDTIRIIDTDTVQVNTTNLIEEPTFLEQWWWLIVFIIVGGIVILVLIKK